MAKDNKQPPMMIFEVLSELEEGTAPAMLSDSLRDLVAAVRATGKKGKLTLTLTVTSLSKGEGRTMGITPQVKVSLPQQETGQTILYATDEGGLSRRDPRQPQLDGLRTPQAPVQMTPRDATKPN